MKHFFAGGAAHGLKHVGANAHAASAAFFVANFSEGDVVMFPHDAIVVIHHVFGNLRCRAGVFGFAFRQFFFRDFLFGVYFGAFGAGDVFYFLQQFFGGFDFAVVFLAGDHLFEQAVFGFGDLVLGHLHFVLQGFIGFVGFYLRGLVFVLADAVFPLFDVQLVFLAVFYGG